MWLRTLLFGLALMAAIVTGQQTSGRAAVASLSGAPVVRRASVAEVSTDTGTALRTCLPSAPELGFSYADTVMSSVAGFSGTLIEGTVISHCSGPVGDVSLGALFIAADGSVSGNASFRADFGLIQPGHGSPFVALTTLSRSQISRVLITVLHFDSVSGPVPMLELTHVVPTAVDAGVSVSYTVVNRGGAPAALPRIAGRLVGAGCADPFALEFLQDGSPLPAGGSVSGNLLIPSSCTGVPELNAGTDEPVPASLPAGLSFAAVRTVYTSDGVLHLVANVCNNSPEDVFGPQFRVRFTGAQAATYTVGTTAIYSGDSCAPLLAAISGAPPGLTFDGLVSASTQSAAQVARGMGHPDLPLVVSRGVSERDPCDPNDFFGLALGFPDIDLLPLSPDCIKALNDFIGPLHGVSGGAQATAPPILLSFLYNGSDAPLSSGDYQVQTLGYGHDGSLVAGIEIANPPSVAARGWSIGMTALDGNSVVASDGDEFRIEGEGFAIPK